MLKHLGILLAGGITFIIVFAVGIFSFLPQEQPPQPAVVVPATPPNADQLEASLSKREATYQAQITQSGQTLQERQTTYQAQLEELNTQIMAAQQQLNQLKAQEQNLLGQAAQLETSRAERLTTYQSQLEQVQNQYQERFIQWQNQLAEAQTRLNEANAQLGR